MLQSIHRKNSTIPALHIPKGFKIDDKAAKQMANYFSKEISNVITKFIIAYHSHPFCEEVIKNFPFNAQFLMQRSQPF